MLSDKFLQILIINKHVKVSKQFNLNIEPTEQDNKLSWESFWQTLQSITWTSCRLSTFWLSHFNPSFKHDPKSFFFFHHCHLNCKFHAKFDSMAWTPTQNPEMVLLLPENLSFLNEFLSHSLESLQRAATTIAAHQAHLSRHSTKVVAQTPKTLFLSLSWTKAAAKEETEGKKTCTSFARSENVPKWK